MKKILITSCVVALFIAAVLTWGQSANSGGSINVGPISAAGSGTVTTVSVTTANGVSAAVATATTTPALTFTLGAITPTTVNGNTITTGTGTLTLGSVTLNAGAGGTLGALSFITPGTGVATALSANNNAAGGYSPIDGTATLTNKRITPRVNTTASASSISINSDTTDMYTVTALAAAATITITGTPTDGQRLTIRILDNGTARALTWSSGTNRGATLATTTVISKYLYEGLVYNGVAATWDCIATSQE